MEVYLSQWVEWKRHPVTRALLSALSEFRRGKLEEIAHGHALNTTELYLEIGRAQGIEDSLQYMAEDVRTDLIDDHETQDA